LVAGVCLAAALVIPFASAAAQGDDWTIPADAATLKSPLEQTPALVEKGKALFGSRCRTCHGPEGRGNGPSSDQKHPAANLTDPAVAASNPEGVLFYKVWNGRKPMPAFRSQLTRDEAWTLVAFVRTLSAPPTAP
jgi:mono/diheme cytochrome c family protein